MEALGAISREVALRALGVLERGSQPVALAEAVERLSGEAARPAEVAARHLMWLAKYGLARIRSR